MFEYKDSSSCCERHCCPEVESLRTEGMKNVVFYMIFVIGDPSKTREYCDLDSGKRINSFSLDNQFCTPSSTVSRLANYKITVD